MILNPERSTYTFQLHHLVNARQNDADDGTEIDEAHEPGHDLLADRLLEAGDTALAVEACSHGGDREGERDDQQRQDVGEHGHDGRVEIVLEGGCAAVRDEHDPEWIGAGVSQLLVVDQEEGSGRPGGDQDHHWNEDLVRDRVHGVVAVDFRLFASLKHIKIKLGAGLQDRQNPIFFTWTQTAIAIETSRMATASS